MSNSYIDGHYTPRDRRQREGISDALKIACLVSLFVIATAIASSAQTFTTLADFDTTNGSYPQYGSLVLGSNGNYYGTTENGGANSMGSVFEITPAGTLTTFYSFCSVSGCADGGDPMGSLVLGSNGNLYGTTQWTVFKLTPTGTLTTLYNFCSQTNCADGSNPYAGLTYYDGILYGTTNQGGANGAGTVFSITTAGKLTTLYSFCSQTNCNDGSLVYSPLVRASNGKLYGVTNEGGAHGFGTVFDITTKGKFTILHTFSFTDGAYAMGGLMQATDKNLYGTTSGGGNTWNGTIFKITTAGKFTTLYSFCKGNYCPDGVGPIGTLIQGSNGNLYGTTANGGTGYRGTVFEITTAGALTTLHNFSGTDGAWPEAGVVQNSNGDFYGTTNEGGDLSCSPPPPSGCGTVFSLTQ
jgi:uncharacterized repeat protein (TIGR03803 family)